MVSRFVIFLIKAYRYLSFIFSKKPSCKFYPTCSVYSIEVFQKYGFLKGLRLSLNRVSRCRPGIEPQIDKP